MKTNILKTAIALVTASASSAFAATNGAAGEGNGLLVWIFIGFMVLVIMIQAVPAIVMFASMLKGLFSTPTKNANLTKH